MNIKWSTVQQLVRIVAQFVGGFLVSQGFITESMTAQFTGAVLSAAALAWWAFWERFREDPKPPTI